VVAKIWEKIDAHSSLSLTRTNATTKCRACFSINWL